MQNDLGSFMIFAGILLIAYVSTTFVAGFLAKQLSFSVLGKFLAILMIGLLCSLIPLGPIGLFFGWPAVLLNSLIIAVVFRKDLAKTISPSTEGTKTE